MAENSAVTRTRGTAHDGQLAGGYRHLGRWVGLDRGCRTDRGLSFGWTLGSNPPATVLTEVFEPPFGEAEPR